MGSDNIVQIMTGEDNIRPLVSRVSATDEEEEGRKKQERRRGKGGSVSGVDHLRNRIFISSSSSLFNPFLITVASSTDAN